MILSIDQNSHSLWDVLPKLQALSAGGRQVHHFVEDVDVAFTALGAEAAGEALRLARERFHPSGGQDWGAALFYSEFLGRLPVEPREWEVPLGMKLAAAAKQLGRSLDDLYEEFSPGDNWQLIGPSYVGDREHHRLIGDLTVAETAPFVRELLGLARADVLRRFPAPDCRRRAEEWFARETARVEGMLGRTAGGRLVELYGAWLGEHLGDAVRLERASSLFAVGADPARTALLEVFCRDYERAAGLYNEAVAETSCGLRGLRTDAGELPFFACLDRDGHLVRTGVLLERGRLRIGERTLALGRGGRLPQAELSAAGVRCLVGKAAVLVLQARLTAPLAVPYRGSSYMPAAHALAAKLGAAGLLPGPLHPVLRVRFGLLDHMRRSDAPVRLPEHLQAAFGAEEVPARRIGEGWAAAAAEAGERLRGFADNATRRRWQQEACREVFAEIADLDTRRRALARTDPKSPEIRQLSHRVRRLEAELTDRTLRQIARDWQLSRIDYWDSRGALLPWAVALGGEGLYARLLAEAEVRPEPAA